MIRFVALIFVVILSSGAQEMRHVSFHKPVRESTTANFRFVYDADVESQMPKIQAYCERAHDLLSTALQHQLSERPMIFVSDRIDPLSGYAGVAPHLLAGLSVNQSLSGLNGLLLQGDIMWVLVVHEVAHLFTLDQGGKTKEELASLFGRVPMGGDLGLPTILLSLLTNARTTLTPAWYAEGWATWAETEYTPSGRGRSAFVDAVWRQKVLAGKLPGPSEIGVTPPEWPQGLQPYTLGQSIFEQLDQETKAGERPLPAQANKEAGEAILFLNRSARSTAGKTFNRIADDGLHAVEQRQVTQIKRLQQEVQTKSPRYSPRRWIINSPSRLPDGRWVMNATPIDNQRPSLVVFDPAKPTLSKAWSRWGDARTDSDSELAVHPDGHVYYTRLDPRGTGELFRSLYRRSAKGRVSRIATSTRFEQIAISPDGKHLIAVRRNSDGNPILVQHPIKENGHLTNGQVRYTPPKDHRLGRPSIGKDGSILVPEVGLTHSWIVRMPIGGGITEHVTGVQGMLIDPIEDPASGDILAAWDKDGVFNIYRFQSGSIEPQRMTHTLGAFLSPRPGKNGTTIALNVDADGVYLTSLKSLTPLENALPDVRPDRPVNAAAAAPAVSSAPISSRPYNGFTSMRFDYWVPVAEASTDGALFGLSAQFSDPADFHHLIFSGGYDTEIEEPTGRIGYRFTGMRAGLSLEASQSTALFTDLIQRETEDGIRLDDYKEVASSGRIGLDWLFPNADNQWLLEVGLQASDRETADSTRVLDGEDLDGFFEGVDTRAYAGLSIDTTTRFAKSHSRENGRLIHIGGDASTDRLGGDLNRQRGIASWTEYISLPWTDHHVIVLNGTYGRARGDKVRQGSFGLGGVPFFGNDGFNPIVSGSLSAPVRGYGYNAQVGNDLQRGSAAWRFPLYRSYRSAKPTSILGLSQISGEFFYDIGTSSFNSDLDEEWISSSGGQLNLGLLLLGQFEVVPSIGVAYAPDQDKIRPVDDGDDEEVRPYFSLSAGTRY